MDCFIKKIWERKEGEAHHQFVRFSKGKFENRAVLILQKTSKIKLKGSFEWANDFVNFASELADIKFSGIILSREKLDFVNEKKKFGIFQYNVLDINSEIIKSIKNKVYAMLLDGEAAGISLKIKKKLPKPGKSGEGKTDDKFCQLETDLKYWESFKESFMLPECKKCRISHIFEINDIIAPEGEYNDMEKIRILSKRRGKITRKIELKDSKSEEEKFFEA